MNQRLFFYKSWIVSRKIEFHFGYSKQFEIINRGQTFLFDNFGEARDAYFKLLKSYIEDVEISLTNIPAEPFEELINVRCRNEEISELFNYGLVVMGPKKIDNIKYFLVTTAKYHDKIKKYFPKLEYREKRKSTVSRGENVCREVLNILFPGKEFKKIRPQWLLNKKAMELDLYCDELKLAIEYNGEQHYRFNKMFHKNLTDFHDQLARDELKAKLCKQRGIRLITVPYTEKNIGLFIQNILKL